MGLFDFFKKNPQPEELIIAVEAGSISSVKKLISKGVDVNTKLDDGRTAIMVASRNGYSDIANILLANGADVNAKSNEGNTALIGASLQGNTDIVKLLVKNGADVNIKAQENDGITALMCASLQGYTEIVKMLLRYGADVNAVTNKDGFTAMMLASQKGHQEIVDALGNVSEEHFLDNVERLDRKQLKKRFLEFDTTWSVERLLPYYKEALVALKRNCSTVSVSFWWATHTLHELFLIDEEYFRERISDLENLDSAKEMITQLHLDNIRYFVKAKSKWQIIRENISVLNKQNMFKQYNDAVIISKYWESLVEVINDYSRPHTAQERTQIAEKAYNLASKFDSCSVVNKIVKIIEQSVASALQRKAGGGGVWTQSINLGTGARSETSNQPSDYDVQKFGEKIVASLNKQILEDCVHQKDYSIIPKDTEQNHNYNLFLKRATM